MQPRRRTGSRSSRSSLSSHNPYASYSSHSSFHLSVSDGASEAGSLVSLPSPLIPALGLLMRKCTICPPLHCLPLSPICRLHLVTVLIVEFSTLPLETPDFLLLKSTAFI
ncbi:hypothetical protein OBBRIDRAFT_822562, partial [Obba rivulosa]